MPDHKESYKPIKGFIYGPIRCVMPHIHLHVLSSLVVMGPREINNSTILDKK